jgi:hypothetical protein
VVNFITHKYLSTNLTFMRRTLEFHVTVLWIQHHKFFYTKTAVKKCSLEGRIGFSFVSISLIDLFANSFKSRTGPLLEEQKVVRWRWHSAMKPSHFWRIICSNDPLAPKIWGACWDKWKYYKFWYYLYSNGLIHVKLSTNCTWMGSCWKKRNGNINVVKLRVLHDK